MEHHKDHDTNASRAGGSSRMWLFRVGVGVFLLGVVLFVVYSVYFQQRWVMSLLAETLPYTRFYFENTPNNVIALTIDDAPTRATIQILDILREFNAHATFFVIGHLADGRQATLQRMVFEGHEVGNHMFRDQPGLFMSPETFEDSLRKTHEIISPFLQEGATRWFRPGSGVPRQWMLPIIKKYNYHVVVGSTYPFDAHFTNTTHNIDFLKRSISPGDIVILHNRKYNYELFRRFLQWTAQDGIRVVTLSELERLSKK